MCRTKLNFDDGKICTMRAWMLCSPEVDSKEMLTCLGLLVYAVYNVTNRRRHGGAVTNWTEENSYEALCQMLKEAVKGHANSMKVLRLRWARQGQMPLGKMQEDRSQLGRLRQWARVQFNRRTARRTGN